MITISPIQLSRWILHNVPDLKSSKNELTHLKLQKLAYYCYGISIAKGFEKHFNFEPWKHGPVSRVIYNEFKQYGSNIIDSKEIERPNIDFPAELKSLLKKFLYLYSSLSPWKIRQQSHLEEPWKNAFKSTVHFMDDTSIKDSFIVKYFQPNKRVYGPEYVFDLSSFKLDGIPTVGYESFEELVDVAKSIYFKEL